MSIEKLANSHASILDAYLARLPLTELRKLVVAHEACLQAQLNGNTSAQMECISQAKATARAAIDSILWSDMRYIEYRIANHVKEVVS